MISYKKSILTKFYIVAAFMTILLFLIVFRIIDIQYLQGDKYIKISKELTEILKSKGIKNYQEIIALILK